MKRPAPTLSDLAVIVTPIPVEVTLKTRSRVATALARLLHPARRNGRRAA